MLIYLTAASLETSVLNMSLFVLYFIKMVRLLQYKLYFKGVEGGSLPCLHFGAFVMVHIELKQKITPASEYSRLEKILLHNFEE